MNATLNAGSVRLMLDAKTAADLMTPNPISIRAEATVAEAVKLLTEKCFTAAPVIDRAGKPIGVLSRTDLLIHDRERVDYLSPRPTDEEEEPAAMPTETADYARVRDIMTPLIFSVYPETPVATAIADMLKFEVHRLFVVDRSGVLVGVISALDVLRHLREWTPDAAEK